MMADLGGYMRWVLLLLLISCGSGDSLGGPPGPDPDPPPGEPSTPPTPGAVASLAIIEGEDQKAEVGKELPAAIVVQVTDAQARAVPDQLINFVVVQGGGSVFAGVAQTNALGEARERWTLGTIAGEQVLEARAVDQSTGEPIVFGRITATADPGPPATLTFADTVQFALNAPREVALYRRFLGEPVDLAQLIAGAEDQYGNAIADPVLSVEASAPFEITGTSVSSPTELTDTIAVVSGGARAWVRLTVVRNLADLNGGHGGYACHGQAKHPIYNNDMDPRGVITDYVVAFTIDSAVYRGGAYVSHHRSESTLWVTEILTLTWSGGSTEVQPVRTESYFVGVQEPGFIGVIRVRGRVQVTSESPLTYVGGALCGVWYDLTSFEPFTLVKE
ncbi:MAG: hypothetical protein ACREMZ_15675 [Gemmatimonadales bacterium]